MADPSPDDLDPSPDDVDPSPEDLDRLPGGQFFQALVNTVHEMIWADGRLDPDELVVAAVVAQELLGENVSFKLILPVLKRPAPPPRVNRSLLTEEQRGQLLLAGVEIAKADGVVDPAEIEALHAIGQQLKLPDADARIAAALADPETVATRWRQR